MVSRGEVVLKPTFQNGSVRVDYEWRHKDTRLHHFHLENERWVSCGTLGFVTASFRWEQSGLTGTIVKHGKAFGRGRNGSKVVRAFVALDQ